MQNQGVQMAESKNFLDMANHIGNKFWKQCISQNATPVSANETSNTGLLQKLALTWLPNQSPGFYLNSKQVKILHEPQSFYNLLLEEIQKAKKRIVLASLYLGTGSLEEKIILALKRRLEEKSDLRVKILLDCTRGSRGEINSRKMILPLLKEHENSCQVTLYQTPFLQGPLIPYLPTKYKEIIGLQHIKLYLFDDNFIITGANLSSDYFTNRQDRYMFISDCKNLSDFIEGLVDRVSGVSLHLNAKDELNLPENWPHDPLKTDPKIFSLAASNWIRSYYDSFIGNTKTDEDDTIIFPLVEMGPFNIHVDSEVTTRVLEQCEEESFVYLTTGYFNLTESYIDTIINKSKASYEILMAHPLANGFYKARGPAGGIPYAYTDIAMKFLEKVKMNQQLLRIKMLEYQRTGWTYHAKGLWLSPNKFHSPFLTMIGSPNFGERSLNHDLECQFLVATDNQDLRKSLLEERDLLYKSCQPFTEATCAEPERRTPFWVKVVVWLFRTYL